MHKRWHEHISVRDLCSGFLLFLTVFFIASCVSPAQRINDIAAESDFERRVVSGDGFRHIVYLKITRPSNPRLHVYIEGDGKPWLHGRYISQDPTTQRPLALELAKLDNENVLYLGRPCYMGLFDDDVCEDKYWTSARYSAEVVESMSAVVSRIAEELKFNKVTLIGYSGGGTLAMLMSSGSTFKLSSYLDSVVTVAANLDVAAWIRQHNYLPLTESLDPLLAHYPESINFMHYIGADDGNVSAEQTLNFVAKHGGRYKILEAVDHSCCWLQHWPELLMRDVNPMGSKVE
jgi:hypothetical protein